MSATKLFHLSGGLLALGGLIAVITNTATSLLFPDNSNAVYATNPSYVPLFVLGAVGAILVLLGLPGLYVRQAEQAGGPGLLGIILIAITAMMFGVFFNLLQALVFPFLAAEAPQLLGGDGPAGFFPFFVIGSVCQVVGSVLFALPMLRGRVLPRWPGYALVVSAALGVVSFFLNGPDSSSSPLAMLVNIGSVDLLVLALGWLGYALWTGRLGLDGAGTGAVS